MFRCGLGVDFHVYFFLPLNLVFSIKIILHEFIRNRNLVKKLKFSHEIELEIPTNSHDIS